MCDMSREMNVEENRLKTLSSWPVDDATRFAKAGFYYTGRDREMQCFFCGAILSDATSSDKLPVCHQFSCLLAADLTSTSNVPLASAVNTNVLESTSSSSQPSDASTNNTDILQRPLDPRRKYGTVEQRLKSFKNWPVPFIVRPLQLALAGFYYLQYKDMVECAFCGGVLMNWKPNQNPDVSHRFCFPNCDFYMNQELDESITNLDNHMTPAYPRYAVYQKRLQTFTHWPKGLAQTPEMLAAAGFYYTGCRDEVKCFHCDGSIQQWDPTDDVWEEHARWFTHCGFVNLIRGPDFVKNCSNIRKPSNSTISTEMPVDETGIYIESPVTLQANDPMIHDTATFEQDVQNSIPFLATAVQCRNSVTNATKFAINVSETSVASLTTLASDKFSKSTLKTLFEKILKDINLNSDMIETEIRLYMTLFIKLKTALEKLVPINESNINIDQLIKDVLFEVVDAKIVNYEPNSPSSKFLKLLKQCIGTASNTANEINVQESPNAAKNKLEKKKADNKSDDIMSLREENRELKKARLCKVCMDRELALVFLPCGHLTTCDLCGPTLKICPLCRSRIRACIRTYLS